jgi:hypothetical protein
MLSFIPAKRNRKAYERDGRDPEIATKLEVKMKREDVEIKTDAETLENTRFGVIKHK